MRPLILAALLALPSVARADLPISPSALCRAAITAAERSMGVPERLMQAIGAVESGRRDETGAISAWPWTINAQGTGSYFASKAEAMAAVVALQARGVRSIDVGCMQVNLLYHADAFPSLAEAFDPGANARYAGRFLTRLLAQTGSWPGATAGYHSLTPDVGADYARKVLAVWAKPASRQPPSTDGTIQQARLTPWAPSAIPPAGTTVSMGSAARVIPLPTSVAMAPGVTTGRGLDAYRAAPTRLAARIMPGRSNPNS